ncbi:MAG: hypothetical protein HZB15_00310, partial [Actinobacteria bacterium]|nr:hypothetical protein [Actinomycetota bacterium]
VVRQPRLLLTLVFGPFLIMAAFGIGYRDEPETMRTLFVAAPGSPFLEQAEQYADEIGEYVDFAGTSTDPVEARRRLMDDEVDLLVTFPEDPLTTVLGGEQAAIVVEHTRLDPVERTAISFASRLAVDEINGQVLAAIVDGGQALAGPAEDSFGAAHAAVTSFDDAIRRGDRQRANEALEQLQDTTARLSLSTRLSSTLSERVGAEDGPAADTAADVQSLRRSILRMDPAATGDRAASHIAEVRALLDKIEQHFDELTATDPAVLVRPFRSDVDLAVSDTEHVTDWYAPAAVVLMLQQFGVAFGALSFVRERQLGITDVFRVAPVSGAE